MTRPSAASALTAALLALAAAAPAAAQPSGPGAEAGGVRVCAGGDVTLGTNLDTAWVHRASARAGRRVAALPDPDSLLRPLRPLVADADVMLWNVEGAIGSGTPSRTKCGPNSTHCYAFRQEPEAAGALRRAAPGAAVVGNVANNHAGDAGWDGFVATARHLEEAGVAVTGRDTLATPVVTARGDTVAFLGFSQWRGPDPRDTPAVRRHVARAAARWPRLVVTMHMGAEGVRAQNTPDRDEDFLGTNRGNSVEFSRAAIAAGADLVVGHGPHVMRAIERWGGGVVFYSLGNLATYGPFSLAEPLNRGAIACAVLERDGRVASAQLRSTRQRPPGLVSADRTGRALVLADSLSRVDFPRTGPVRIDPDGTVVLGPRIQIVPARTR